MHHIKTHMRGKFGASRAVDDRWPSSEGEGGGGGGGAQSRQLPK